MAKDLKIDQTINEATRKELEKENIARQIEAVSTEITPLLVYRHL